MGRAGSSVPSTDPSLHKEKPKIPAIEKQINLHYFGPRSDRQAYGIVPESFTEISTLPELLVPNRVASYLYLAAEDNLELVVRDSVLVVDQSLKAQVGNMVVIGYEGENLLRRFIKLRHPQKKITLPAFVTDNENDPIIYAHDDYPDVYIKGVVRCIITFVRPCH